MLFRGALRGGTRLVGTGLVPAPPVASSSSSSAARWVTAATQSNAYAARRLSTGTVNGEGAGVVGEAGASSIAKGPGKSTSTPSQNASSVNNPAQRQARSSTPNNNHNTSQRPPQSQQQQQQQRQNRDKTSPPQNERGSQSSPNSPLTSSSSSETSAQRQGPQYRVYENAAARALAATSSPSSTGSSSGEKPQRGDARRRDWQSEGPLGEKRGQDPNSGLRRLVPPLLSPEEVTETLRLETPHMGRIIGAACAGLAKIATETKARVYVLTGPNNKDFVLQGAPDKVSAAKAAIEAANARFTRIYNDDGTMRVVRGGSHGAWAQRRSQDSKSSSSSQPQGSSAQGEGRGGMREKIAGGGENKAKSSANANYLNLIAKQAKRDREKGFTESEMEVDNNLAGVIIGRGGANVEAIQKKTGARLTIARGKGKEPGTSVIQIAGTEEGIKAAKEEIARVSKEFEANGSPRDTVHQNFVVEERLLPFLRRSVIAQHTNTRINKATKGLEELKPGVSMLFIMGSPRDVARAKDMLAVEARARASVAPQELKSELVELDEKYVKFLYGRNFARKLGIESDTNAVLTVGEKAFQDLQALKERAKSGDAALATTQEQGGKKTTPEEKKQPGKLEFLPTVIGIHGTQSEIDAAKFALKRFMERLDTEMMGQQRRMQQQPRQDFGVAPPYQPGGEMRPGRAMMGGGGARRREAMQSRSRRRSDMRAEGRVRRVRKRHLRDVAPPITSLEIRRRAVDEMRLAAEELKRAAEEEKEEAASNVGSARERREEGSLKASVTPYTIAETLRIDPQRVIAFLAFDALPPVPLSDVVDTTGVVTATPSTTGVPASLQSSEAGESKTKEAAAPTEAGGDDKKEEGATTPSLNADPAGAAATSTKNKSNASALTPRELQRAIHEILPSAHPMSLHRLRESRPEDKVKRQVTLRFRVFNPLVERDPRFALREKKAKLAQAEKLAKQNNKKRASRGDRFRKRSEQDQHQQRQVRSASLDSSVSASRETASAPPEPARKPNLFKYLARTPSGVVSEGFRFQIR